MPPSLRVSVGPSLEKLRPITDLVNTNKSARISSDLFEGEIVVNIKGFVNEKGEVSSSEYFDREDRQGVSWSFQVQGRFLETYSSDDILFGNTFERPLQLPWGSGAALKFMHFIDPTLEHDLTSPTKPWALSPLITTMPHLAHIRLGSDTADSPASSSSSLELRSTPPKFPPSHSVVDDTSHLHLALGPFSVSPSPSSSSSSLASLSSGGKSTKSSGSFKSRLSSKKSSRKQGNGQPYNFATASQRRTHFGSVDNRQAIQFGPQDVITTDFCYGFLEFSPTISLRIPGGLSFDLMRYWDGQPVRFVCCERKDPNTEDNDGVPWGRIFWCVVIELYDP
ncbi:duf1769 family protein [Moniliophthora roreri MCA 2997]|uniref:Duf1769 family protein n=2 Tax=Moniliophthora roreri TaxID=221103 RepID=V2X7K6_MONRO|nr:duf1769 family protein [Moniliophthora roreri MCA 2997]KAI3601242.1 duf1769 family protein [Moniliophthora roreri]